MSKVAILACSNAGLDYLDYPKDIRILRSVIHFGTDEAYDDFVQMDAKTFYERIQNDPDDIPRFKENNVVANMHLRHCTFYIDDAIDYLGEERKR